MRNKKIEKRIRNEFSNETPDVLKQVLEKCTGKKEVLSEKNKRFHFKPFLAFMTAFACTFVFGVFMFNNHSKSLSSTIIFDVNPSIEIKVDSKKNITSANALNSDGKKILEDMNLSGTKLNIGINAIVGSMYKNGYISELKNSILVTVDNKDKQKANKLQEEVTDEIDKSLKMYNIDSAILSQKYDIDSEIEKKAKEYGISKGKAELLKKIIESNLSNKNGVKYTFEDLVNLSINELNVILNSKNKKVNNLTSTGNASTKSYIGINQAKQTALNTAGVSESNIFNLEIELDYEYNIMIYEVSFDYNGVEYEYEINAATGEIINDNTEYDNDYYQPTNNSSNNSYTNNYNSSRNSNNKSNIISRDKAKQIAFSSAGVVNIRNLSIEFDNENGKMIYEIDFKSGNTEYEYHIDASNGAILHKNIEIDD